MKQRVYYVKYIFFKNIIKKIEIFVFLESLFLCVYVSVVKCYKKSVQKKFVSMYQSRHFLVRGGSRTYYNIIYNQFPSFSIKNIHKKKVKKHKCEKNCTN